MLEHWFWLLMSITCVVWYLTVTVYVAIKGFTDVKTMFAKMARDKEEGSGNDQ